MPSSPRPRGAPPGNINALKHGLYSRRLKGNRLHTAGSANISDLLDETAVVRIFTRRLIEGLDPYTGVSQLASNLRMLCVVLTTITRLMKTQPGLSTNSSGMDAVLSQAICEVYHELQALYRVPGLHLCDIHSSAPPTPGPSSPSSPTS